VLASGWVFIVFIPTTFAQGMASIVSVGMDNVIY
jgi:hypothetical protein